MTKLLTPSSRESGEQRLVGLKGLLLLTLLPVVKGRAGPSDSRRRKASTPAAFPKCFEGAALRDMESLFCLSSLNTCPWFGPCL